MKCTAGEEFVELIPETDFERKQLQRVARFAHLCTDITVNSAADSSAWSSLGPTGTVLLLLKVPEMDESHVVGNLKARAERDNRQLITGKQIMIDAMHIAEQNHDTDSPMYLALRRAFSELPDVSPQAFTSAEI